MIRVLLVCFVAFTGAEPAVQPPTVLEGIARAGIGAVLSQVLGVPAAAERVRLDPKEQVLEVTGLRIGNPKGFSTSHAITIDQIRVEADPKLLFSGEPVVRLIQVAGAAVNAEANTHGINLKKLLDHAAPRGRGGKPAPKQPEKRWRIEKALLDKCSIDITTDLLQRNTTHKTFDTMEWQLTGTNGEGVTANEAVGIVLQDLVDKSGLLDGKTIEDILSPLVELIGK